MAKRGWPKGKPRGPYSPERRNKLIAAGKRAAQKRKIHAAELASGVPLGGNGIRPQPQQAAINFSPAVWRPITDHVGDCEYVDGDLDEVLMRALHERVVYAQSLDCHHEPLFKDITYSLLTGVEKEFRKNGRRRKMPKPPLPTVTKKVPVPVAMLADPRKVVTISKKTGYREGRPLLAVVEELFSP